MTIHSDHVAQLALEPNPFEDSFTALPPPPLPLPPPPPPPPRLSQSKPPPPRSPSDTFPSPSLSILLNHHPPSGATKSCFTPTAIAIATSTSNSTSNSTSTSTFTFTSTSTSTSTSPPTPTPTPTPTPIATSCTPTPTPTPIPIPSCSSSNLPSHAPSHSTHAFLAMLHSANNVASAPLPLRSSPSSPSSAPSIPDSYPHNPLYLLTAAHEASSRLCQHPLPTDSDTDHAAASAAAALTGLGSSAGSRYSSPAPSCSISKLHLQPLLPHPSSNTSPTLPSVNLSSSASSSSSSNSSSSSSSSSSNSSSSSSSSSSASSSNSSSSSSSTTAVPPLPPPPPPPPAIPSHAPYSLQPQPSSSAPSAPLIHPSSSSPKRKLKKRKEAWDHSSPLLAPHHLPPPSSSSLLENRPVVSLPHSPPTPPALAPHPILNRLPRASIHPISKSNLPSLDLLNRHPSANTPSSPPSCNKTSLRRVKKSRTCHRPANSPRQEFHSAIKHHNLSFSQPWSPPGPLQQHHAHIWPDSGPQNSASLQNDPSAPSAGPPHKDSLVNGYGSGKPETEEEKRKSFLERNRQAALKCRQRKKAWLANLQTKVEVLTSENEALQMTIDGLRTEIESVRSILLSHKDCPISISVGSNAGGTGAPCTTVGDLVGPELGGIGPSAAAAFVLQQQPWQQQQQHQHQHQQLQQCHDRMSLPHRQQPAHLGDPQQPLSQTLSQPPSRPSQAQAQARATYVAAAAAAAAAAQAAHTVGHPPPPSFARY